MIKFYVYERPHQKGDVDVNVPPSKAIIPNRILHDTDALEIILQIRNDSLKSRILNSKNIDEKLAYEINIYNEKVQNLSLKVGMLVLLKVELMKSLPRRFHKVVEVNTDMYYKSFSYN